MIAIGPFAIVALLIIVAIIVAVGQSTLKSSGDGKPRGFPWLLTVFGGVVILGVVTIIIYKARPTEFFIEIIVPPGSGFIGEVIVDGRRQVIQGTDNEEFVFAGDRIDFVILSDDESGSEVIDVHFHQRSGGGGSTSSSWGSRGFSEKGILWGASGFSALDERDWRSEMPRLRPPEVEADSILPGIAAPSNPIDGTDASDLDSSTDGADQPENESEVVPPAESTTDKWLRVVIETAYT